MAIIERNVVSAKNGVGKTKVIAVNCNMMVIKNGFLDLLKIPDVISFFRSLEFNPKRNELLKAESVKYIPITESNSMKAPKHAKSTELWKYVLKVVGNSINEDLSDFMMSSDVNKAKNNTTSSAVR